MLDAAIARRIRLLGSDVDGCLTDNGLYIGAVGGERVEFKRFDVLDGLAATLLCRAGIEMAWVSGRQSAATTLRGSELQVRAVLRTNHPRVKRRLVFICCYKVDFLCQRQRPGPRQHPASSSLVTEYFFRRQRPNGIVLNDTPAPPFGALRARKKKWNRRPIIIFHFLQSIFTICFSILPMLYTWNGSPGSLGYVNKRDIHSLALKMH